MPPLAVALALSSAIIHASWNAVLKRGQDRLTDLALIGIGGVALGLVIMAVFGAPSPAAWGFLAASAIVHALYWYTLLKGYEAGDLSHVYTLSRGGAPLLVAIGAAFAAREIPSPADAVGIGIVSLGIFSIGVSPRAPLRATLWGASIAACVASYSLLDALGARAAGNSVLYSGWITFLVSAPVIAFAFLRRGRARLMKDMSRNPLRGLAIGIISNIGYGIVLFAQTFSPIAQVTALRETSVVFGAIIGWAFLKERVGARRFIGAGLAACGAAIIAFL